MVHLCLQSSRTSFAVDLLSCDCQFYQWRIDLPKAAAHGQSTDVLTSRIERWHYGKRTKQAQKETTDVFTYEAI